MPFPTLLKKFQVVILAHAQQSNLQSGVHSPRHKFGTILSTLSADRSPATEASVLNVATSWLATFSLRLSLDALRVIEDELC